MPLGAIRREKVGRMVSSCSRLKSSAEEFLSGFLVCSEFMAVASRSVAGLLPGIERRKNSGWRFLDKLSMSLR